MDIWNVHVTIPGEINIVCENEVQLDLQMAIHGAFNVTIGGIFKTLFSCHKNSPRDLHNECLLKENDDNPESQWSEFQADENKTDNFEHS